MVMRHGFIFKFSHLAAPLSVCVPASNHVLALANALTFGSCCLATVSIAAKSGRGMSPQECMLDRLGTSRRLAAKPGCNAEHGHALAGIEIEPGAVGAILRRAR